MCPAAQTKLEEMKGFHVSALLALLLSFFTLGFTEDDNDDSSESNEKEKNKQKRIIQLLESLLPKGNNPKKECKEKSQKECNGETPKRCECDSNPGEDLPISRSTSRTNTYRPTSKTITYRSTSRTNTEPSPESLTTRTPASSYRTGSYTTSSTIGSSKGTHDRPAMTIATEPPSSTRISSRPAMTIATEPPSSARISSRVAIFVPLAILLILLVLLAVFLLWRYSHHFQCWRRLRGNDEDIVKMKPKDNEVTIHPPGSDPQGSEVQTQLPPSGHVYQEIADNRVGAPGPDPSYSTVGFPYQDQNAADKQPPDGQYSLLGLSKQ